MNRVKMNPLYLTLFLQDGVVFINDLDSHFFVECYPTAVPSVT